MATPENFIKDGNDLTKGKWSTQRRIMRSFKIGEISGVDVPAQEGARFIFSKALAQPNGPAEFAKIAFREALESRMIDSAFSTIFYEAFEHQWQAQEALREALKDRFADSEQSVRDYVATIAEMALVAADQTRGLAKAKKADKTIIEKAVEAAVKSISGITTEDIMYKTLAELKAAIKALAGGDKTIKATDIQKAAIDLAATDLLVGDLSLSQPDPELAKLRRQVAELSMTADVRKFYGALGETEKAAFLLKSSADQLAQIAATNSDDPIVYTTKSGLEIRKSAGETSVALAKQLDATVETIKALTKSGDDARFEAIYKAEFNNLPRQATIALLKAAETMSEEDKKKLLEAQRAANKALESRTRFVGKAAGNFDDVSDDPEAQLDAMAKARVEKTKETFAKAYDHVIQSEGGRELYAKFVAANAA